MTMTTTETTVTAPQPATELGRRVRAAYCELHDDFAGWKPSAAFQETFRLSVLAELQRRLTSGLDTSILEIGCGHGTWAEAIAQSHATNSDNTAAMLYHGIDFTESRIALARERFAAHRDVTFEVGDAETLQPDTQYDVILVIEVISHVAPARHALWMQRLAGWLRPGGCVIVIDKDRYSRHSIKFAWDRFKRRVLGGRASYYFPQRYDNLITTLHYPSFRRLARLANDAGLTADAAIRHSMFHALVLRRPM